MKNIYFAGPDVFNQDYAELKAMIRALCAKYDINPFLPGDIELDNAESIFTTIWP